MEKYGDVCFENERATALSSLRWTVECADVHSMRFENHNVQEI